MFSSLRYDYILLWEYPEIASGNARACSSSARLLRDPETNEPDREKTRFCYLKNNKMEKTVSIKTVLSDSLEKTRPNFKTFLLTDANAGGNAMAQIEEKRKIRQMKFPDLRGRHDCESFQKSLDDQSFKVNELN